MEEQRRSKRSRNVRHLASRQLHKFFTLRSLSCCRALFIFIEIQFSQIICLVSFVASTKLSARQLLLAADAPQRGFLFIISEALGNHKWLLSMTSTREGEGGSVTLQAWPQCTPACLLLLLVLVLGFAYDKASKL